ncbi:hypothetical protein Asppvi_000023 [Aspergillus pseudoviridinutans]|uniref:Cytochrome P450 n=1 Tax=Aspergillus pseudoviridinutans TaxID=1517512 RepID=A0A9P3B4T3_9EURO|nr:uncharacterized protein Asppvi_000023 [Aspergillus pseudoviridinutans]GIJ81524.1 hypothetical protein Asppvi_000023 [Aspergillus pseudoviridinutans]
MENVHFLTYAAVVIVLAVIAFQHRSSNLPRGTGRPPSPKHGLPILGHVLQIPSFHSWLKFKTWTDELGPIVRFRIFGRENIVVSNEKIANDLLRERGTLYSSREHLTMASDLLSDNLRPLLIGYTERWRRGRKLMHRLTMTSAANSYQPIQSLESKRMLYDLLRDPSRYGLWFERYAGGVIFRLGYGKTINTGEEEHVRKAFHVVHTVERIASPGSYLVDSLSFLKYLPEQLAPFKKEGRILHQEELNFFRTLVSDVQAEIAAGVAGPSFVRTWLEDKESFDLTDDEAAYVIGTLFEAGSGTTASAMMSFILAMVLFPQWQQAMWDELDGLVGDRMPEFEDVPNLPVCRAVIKEVLRWRPVTAGGVPHQLTQDDIYNGYFFPKGTNVHANQWAIHRDPELYPDPENFNPDRWLNRSYPTYREPLSKYPSLQNFSAFGFGRRICPGMNIAERSLYILPARIMWACRITKAKDERGADITPPLYNYTTGFNTQPKPFPFHLEARSEKRKIAVKEAWEEAQKGDPLAWTVNYKLGHSFKEKFGP